MLGGNPKDKHLLDAVANMYVGWKVIENMVDLGMATKEDAYDAWTKSIDAMTPTMKMADLLGLVDLRSKRQECIDIINKFFP